jgi:hypothetical protein
MTVYLHCRVRPFPKSLFYAQIYRKYRPRPHRLSHISDVMEEPECIQR